MVTLIVTILIVYLCWLVLGPAIARFFRRKMTERVEDMFARQFGMPNAKEARRRYEESRRQAERTARRSRKIFSKDEGEYIEFEEIEVSATSYSTYTSPADFTPESQIADAEWEDLK
ncbi:MAG: DUF4834 family protein [Duncaniella sp.]|nr:DUF4834 family protein [Duncaniella sp.]